MQCFLYNVLYLYKRFYVLLRSGCPTALLFLSFFSASSCTRLW